MSDRLHGSIQQASAPILSLGLSAMEPVVPPLVLQFGRKTPDELPRLHEYRSDLGQGSGPDLSMFRVYVESCLLFRPPVLG